MQVLDDPKLLAQCARIKAMIEKVAHDPKYQDDYYAEEYHHWQIIPPVQLSEIEEFEKYTHTKKYIEEVARDRLGLVYEGEILFKDEN